MVGGLSADDVGKINKLQMNWIRESERQYIGNRYWAKRATVYVLDACKLVCVVRGQRAENVEENGDEAKRNEGCADKKVVWGITNVWARVFYGGWKWGVEAKINAII